MALAMQNFYGGGGVYSPSSPIARYSSPKLGSDSQAQMADLQKQLAEGKIDWATYSTKRVALANEAKRLASLTPQQRLAEDFQKQQDAAKAANEQRYQQLLSEQAGMGEQEAKDIRASWAGRESQGMQDLVSRGISASTIMPTMRAGYQRQANADLGRLGDRLRDQRLGIIERRDDEYPDLNQLITLSQMQGAYGGGGGGGVTVPNYIGAPMGVRPQAIRTTPEPFSSDPGGSGLAATAGAARWGGSPYKMAVPQTYPVYSSTGGTQKRPSLFSGMYE